jgi:DNA-directed RNA polymerase specialized sigma24 family protein
VTQDADMAVRQRAARGDPDALAVLVSNHGREVMTTVAGYADRWSAVEQIQRSTWSSVRNDLATIGDLAAALDRCARQLTRSYLEEADRDAISERDALRRLVVQAGLDDLRAAPSASAITQVTQRLATLPADARSLLDLRYRQGLDHVALAATRRISEGELATRMCAARSALDWRDSGEFPASDRLMPTLTEDHLAGTLDGDSRDLLVASLGQDLGRSRLFARQVRMHLLLQALLTPLDERRAQIVARAVTGKVDSGRVRTGGSPASSSVRRTHSSDATRVVASGRRGTPGQRKSPLLPIVIAGAVLVAAALAVLLLAPARRAPPAMEPATGRRAGDELPPPRPTISEPPAATPGASPLRPVQLPGPVAAPGADSPTPPAAVKAEAQAPATPGVVIESVSLIDSVTGLVIPGYEVLPEDSTLRLSGMPMRRFSVLFNVSPQVKAVGIHMPGALRADGLEKTPPFGLGLRDRGLHSWLPSKGFYVLTLMPYGDQDATRAGLQRSWRIHIE